MTFVITNNFRTTGCYFPQRGRLVHFQNEMLSFNTLKPGQLSGIILAGKQALQEWRHADSLYAKASWKGFFSFRVYPTGFTVDPKIASVGVRDGEFLSEHLCPLWQSRGIWRLKVFGVITTRTWLDTPGLCDPESTGKVWASLPICLWCILILHEMEDQFEGSGFFLFFFFLRGNTFLRTSTQLDMKRYGNPLILTLFAVASKRNQ